MSNTGTHEYCILLTAGEPCFLSGFDTTAGVMRAIETEWNDRHTEDSNLGLAVADGPNSANAYVTLINPATVVCVIDMRSAV